MEDPDCAATPLASPRSPATAFAYGVMLLAGVGIYLLIRSYGETLSAPPAPPEAPTSAAAVSSAVLWHVLLAMAVVILAARGMGHAFERWLGQPPVMGEIVAGLLLGPSLLGALSYDAYLFLVPPEAAPYLGVVSKTGIVLFMFLVGLELDTRLLRGNVHATMAISHASILAPFLLGSTLALLLYPIYSHDGVSFTSFSLFVGVSLSVTAFPVLARILGDRRAQHSPLGVTAIACAAIDDVTAWCLLALVAGVATAELGNTMMTLVWVVLYLLAAFFLVRPGLRRLSATEARREGPLSLNVFAVVVAAVLLSASATEAIGIHALFGAFVVGAMLPHDGRLANQLRSRMEDLVSVFLLPVFFAFTGMRTSIGLVSTVQDWLLVVLIIGAATLGKFGGTLVAARLSRLGWRESAALGILMNTRGLMELIVLNVGLDMGVLSPTLFTMLVLMALVTTFTTTPIFHMLTRGTAHLNPGGRLGEVARRA